MEQTEIRITAEGKEFRNNVMATHGADKLIVLSHRPPQLFRPKGDPGERHDLAAHAPEAMRDLFRRLGEWESTLATVPLWYPSPRYAGKSAETYDTFAARAEPR